MLVREREDRKRRKEHERKKTKRTDEVEQQTENQEEAARTSQKSTFYWPQVLFFSVWKVNPKVVVEWHTLRINVDLSSDDGCEHRLFRLIMEGFVGETEFVC